MVCADEIDAINFVGRKCRRSKGGVHISANTLSLRVATNMGEISPLR